MTKALARGTAKRTLAAMKVERREAMSAEISRLIFGTSAWREADAVLAYISMDDEADTGPLIREARGAGKTVAAPRVEAPGLVFHIIGAGRDSYSTGSFGILEPDRSLPRFDPATELAGGGRVLVIVPGLAFDAGLHRLGRGKGFYDRLLHDLRAAACGLTKDRETRPSAGCRGAQTTAEPGAPSLLALAPCFSVQLWPEVPHGDGDERVDAIVTEKGVIGRSGFSA
jgi:5-formyltetrahydrofolate cyclo-ligase